jgi:hypothetical protein
MGQQVPFETIDGMAKVLQRATGVQNQGLISQAVNVRIVDVNNKKLPRAELTIQKGGIKKEVHIYEAYWAPLTEGQTTLRDVHAFLWNAGWEGLRHSVSEQGFARWMFGGLKQFTISRPAKILLYFALALSTLWSLTFLNGIVLAVAASRTLTSGISTWPDPSLLADLSLDVLLLSVVLLTAGAALIFSLEGPRFFRSSWFMHVINCGVWIALIATPIIGLLVLYHLIHHENPNTASFWPAALVRFLVNKNGETTSINPVPIAVIWAILIYVTMKVRWFLVQYVGDVAAYISTNTLTKFYEIRQKIQEAALSVAIPVYQAKTSGSDISLYASVVMVGHSLGSVIAYDTLNALILNDSLLQRRGTTSPCETLKRTKALVTFGSPLNKTAFIFRNQKERSQQIREALAAAVQPMIVDYSNRPFPWVNIYSHRDWISGELEYYDDPTTDSSHHVENIIDRDANVPIAAHTQYWNNQTLTDVLYKLL